VHVAEYIRRYDELAAAGLRHVAVFHSRLDEMEEHLAGAKLPFDVLADPERRAFEAYEVERSWAGIMSPRFMAKAMRGMMSGYLANPLGQTGGMIGLPASFLLDGAGMIRAAHYGAHAGDSWDVDTALAKAREVFAEPETGVGASPRA
jgi:peroxiredoxin